MATKIMSGLFLEFANPANIYLLKFNNRNTRKRCEICSKLTMKAIERCHPCRSVISIKLIRNFIEITLWHGWRRSGVDFEQ